MLREAIRNWLFDRVGASITRFSRIESAAGMILIVATIAAMILKNSPFSALYVEFLNLEGQVRLGAIDVHKPLFLWVNDLWMALFFFVVGLEIKNEWLFGHLRDRRQALLPIIGAIGGFAVPALVFILINWNSPESLRGWAIPMATDIAFALAVVATLGSRVPNALVIFLMTLAILVIALFYTDNLSAMSMMSAGMVIGLMLLLRWLHIRSLAPYMILGGILWVCVLKSGVHATLAGVVTAFLLPAVRHEHDDETSIDDIIHDLHPWVAFFILPTFAFVNAGIDFSGLEVESLLHPLPLGIFLGLVVGKSLGVFGFSFVAIKAGLVSLPAGSNWFQLFGIAMVCGIGFTMSLFIGGLAFEEMHIGYNRIDRFAVILASLVSAVLGYLILYVSSKKPKVHDEG